MITVTTPVFCVSLPDRIVPGQPLTSLEAEVLERLKLSRLRWYVNVWLEKGITAKNVQTNLLALAKTYEFTASPPSAAYDPIELESLNIARQLVRKKLAEKDIELSEENVDRHATEVAKMPRVRERAQEIVQHRQRAAKKILAGVGK